MCFVVPSYIHRLRLLYFHLLWNLWSAGVALSAGDIEYLVENQQAKIYYSFSSLRFLQANKPDILLSEKAMYILYKLLNEILADKITKYLEDVKLMPKEQ